MDAAEAWLAQNDPDYPESRKAWRDLNADGEYETPWREIPVGLAGDLALIVESGKGRHLVTASARHCRHCDSPFVARAKWHVYCSDSCRQHARPKRADYMRDYRRRIRDQAETEAEIAWDLGVLPDDHPFAA